MRVFHVERVLPNRHTLFELDTVAQTVGVVGHFEDEDQAYRVAHALRKADAERIEQATMFLRRWLS